LYILINRGRLNYRIQTLGIFLKAHATLPRLSFADIVLTVVTLVTFIYLFTYLCIRSFIPPFHLFGTCWQSLILALTVNIFYLLDEILCFNGTWFDLSVLLLVVNSRVISYLYTGMCNTSGECSLC